MLRCAYCAAFEFRSENYDALVKTGSVAGFVLLYENVVVSGATFSPDDIYTNGATYPWNPHVRRLGLAESVSGEFCVRATRARNLV